MSDLVTKTQALEKVLLTGDLSGLKPEEKINYYNVVCESVGLNPMTKPFDYMKLGGKEVLYANKTCGDQLRSKRRISITITSREKIDDVYVVTAEAKDENGRTDSSTGAVTVAGLKGEALANAYMKAETKAKRRVTLSLCGLGLLDESEVDSVASAEKIPPPRDVSAPTQEIEPKQANFLDRLKKNNWTRDQLDSYVRMAFNKDSFSKLDERSYRILCKILDTSTYAVAQKELMAAMPNEVLPKENFDPEFDKFMNQ